MVKKLWMNVDQYINWLKQQQIFKEIEEKLRSD